MFRSLATMVTAALSLPGCALQNKTEEFQTVPYFEVAADFETEPVLDPDDSADDIAVAFSMELEKTWIIGTNKRRGLEIYDINGKRIMNIDRGRLNNVDLRRGSHEHIFEVAASNRTLKSLDIFKANLETETITLVNSISLDYEDPYGVCASDSIVFVGDKKGNLQGWGWDSQSLDYEIQFNSQTEGCVISKDGETLFVGEENVGIWSVDIESGLKKQLLPISRNLLVADVEGLTIFENEEDSYLIASSQGDNSFVIYSLNRNEPIAKFRISSGIDLDPVSETDGIDAFSTALPGYRSGILVVQDGVNTNEKRDRGFRNTNENQNFKIIAWSKIERELSEMGFN